MALEGSLHVLFSPKSPYPLTQFVGSLINIFLVVLSLLFVFFSFSCLASLGFSVWTKFVICLLMIFLFAVNTCQFSFRNARMISTARGIHPSWQGLIRLLAQFLLPGDYSSSFLYLEFLTRLLERSFFFFFFFFFQITTFTYINIQYNTILTSYYRST